MGQNYQDVETFIFFMFLKFEQDVTIRSFNPCLKWQPQKKLLVDHVV